MMRSVGSLALARGLRARLLRAWLAALAPAAGLALALLLLSQTAAAWGPLGHRTIGAVAEALLDPAARAEVARLLRDDHDRADHRSGRTTLAEVSLWADEIRGTDAARPAWHYDNVPACGPIPREPTWCPQQQCASGQIEPLLRQLADRSRPVAQRRDALKWITHLVGDLHQPLHAVDYAQGGNLVHVQFGGHSKEEPWTLHAAWDVRFVASALHAQGSQSPPAAALKMLIERARRVPAAQREAPVEQWVDESNRLARQVALDYPRFACGSVPSEPIVLSLDYQQRAQRIITSRLVLAGARLATMLNRALPPP